MNSIRTLITSSVVALAAALPTAAFANYAPVPTKIVGPTQLPLMYRDVHVTVALQVDATGHVSHIRPLGLMDQALQARLLPALAQWEFAPGRNAKGVPVTTEVILPLELVDGGS